MPPKDLTEFKCHDKCGRTTSFTADGLPPRGSDGKPTRCPNCDTELSATGRTLKEGDDLGEKGKKGPSRKQWEDKMKELKLERESVSGDEVI